MTLYFPSPFYIHPLYCFIAWTHFRKSPDTLYQNVFIPKTVTNVKALHLSISHFQFPISNKTALLLVLPIIADT